MRTSDPPRPGRALSALRFLSCSPGASGDGRAGAPALVANPPPRPAEVEEWRRHLLHRGFNGQAHSSGNALPDALLQKPNAHQSPRTPMPADAARFRALPAAARDELEASRGKLAVLHADGQGTTAAHQAPSGTVIFDLDQSWIPQKARPAEATKPTRYCHNCDAWLGAQDFATHSCGITRATRPWAFVEGHWILNPAEEIHLQTSMDRLRRGVQELRRMREGEPKGLSSSGRPSSNFYTSAVLAMGREHAAGEYGEEEDLLEVAPPQTPTSKTHFEVLPPRTPRVPSAFGPGLVAPITECNTERERHYTGECNDELWGFDDELGEWVRPEGAIQAGGREHEEKKFTTGTLTEAVRQWMHMSRA